MLGIGNLRSLILVLIRAAAPMRALWLACRRRGLLSQLTGGF
jgi:nitroreductase